jgi:hypothetical protein
MKKTSLIFILAILCWSNLVKGQAPNWQWAKGSGGAADDDFGNSVVADGSGNVYVTGAFMSSTIIFGSYTLTNTASFGSNNNVFVTKYDPTGNVVWAKNFGGTTAFNGSGIGKGIDIDGSGNLYITGTFFGTGMTFGSTTLTNTDATGAGEIFLTKLDGSGNVIWAKSAGGVNADGPNSIKVDGNNIYITGIFASTSITFGSTTLNLTPFVGTPTYDIFIAKYDSSGNLVWAKKEGTAANESSNSITTDTGGNVYIAGTFYLPSITFGSITLTASAATNLFLVKYDASGTVIWAKTATITGGGNHGATAISTDPSNNVYFTGSFISPTISFGSITLTRIGTTLNYFIAKYDASGTAIWAKNAGDILGTISSGTGIANDASGDVYVTGNFEGKYMVFGTDSVVNNNTAGNNEDVFIAKYNTAGTLQWAKSAGGTYLDRPNDFCLNGIGEAIITGQSQSNPITFGSILVAGHVGYSDLFVAKLGAITGIIETSLDNKINIYPNPNNGVFYLKSEILISQVEILNILGEKIWTHYNPYHQYLNEIALTNLPAGTYFVIITDKIKNQITKKIIIN